MVSELSAHVAVCEKTDCWGKNSQNDIYVPLSDFRLAVFDFVVEQDLCS